ncbi:MAG: hypothetical protein JWN84_3227 [Nocardioides sp.]|nr:hypothetical protein [Nocardioides sp.]
MSATSTVAVGTRVRLDWMDAARGLAIVLVLFGHSIGVPINQGLESPDVLSWVRGFFQPFRMPLLLFLSGLLLVRALEKSPRRFLQGKWQAILWPFLLWNLIRWATRAGSVDLWDRDLWLNPGYLWYLLFIFVYYVLALLLRRLPAMAPALLFLAAWLVIGDSSALSPFVQNAVFFFGGYAAISLRPTLAPPRSALVVVPLGVITVATGALCAQGLIPQRDVLLIPATFGGILVLFRLCEVAAERPAFGWLQWVGRNSLIFYVSHFPVMSATTKLLGGSGAVPEQWIWLPSLLLAVAVTVLFVWMQRFPWARWPYRAPRLLGGAPTAAPAGAGHRLP